ncbi:M23 family metallopeptidase [Arenibacterium sp. CAU 1754]
MSQPIDCVLGETCHIQQFVDRDIGPGARDYFCGGLSYDGHQGTDFGLSTLADMRRGVDVLAAAPGVVENLRDGMEDMAFTADTRARVAGRECGNGVVIRHDGGYVTQYCHMKKGSLSVKQGDRVARGAVLGQVGLSGLTQFPHLHLSVRLNDTLVDPFDTDDAETCGPPGRDLWQETPLYQSSAILDIGFTNGIPGYDDIQDGTAAQVSLLPDAGGLVLFGYAFGGQAGDVVRLTIAGPKGAMLDQSLTLEKDQARYFRAAGKKLKTDRWPAGNYLGTVSLIRAGKELDRRQVSMTLD